MKHLIGSIFFGLILLFVFNTFIKKDEENKSIKMPPPEERINFSPRKIVGVPARFAAYERAVDPHLAEVRELALSLASDCGIDTECKVARIYRFVQEKVRYLSDPAEYELIQRPERTMALMAGDCEDLAILTASLLLSLDVQTELVAIPGHMYAMACGVDPKRLYDMVSAEYRDAGSGFSKTFTLQNGSKWYSSFREFRKRSSFRIEIESSADADVYLLPEREELDRFLRRENFTYMTYCSRENIRERTLTCDIEPGNYLAVTSDERSFVQVRIISEIKNRFDRIRVYNRNGVKCIPLDAAIKGEMVVPGMESENAELRDKSFIPLIR
ncbi:transglutaminase-like domain-containing protein [Limisalsivibrio acetivorans]|uniref:transglutaminase-like domain-containing protein n=1 Tax=Limisalsivibrio acetivorans TaxID=1304888 RepID=UPI0003B46731|nr:transglutaminase-like domain-containing protein [Limisalsivibrio acetivorans]